MPAGRCPYPALVLPRKSVSLASGRRVGYNSEAVVPEQHAGWQRSSADPMRLGSEGDWKMGWNDLVGRQLGPYTILDEPGRGGPPPVYRRPAAAPTRACHIH